MRKIVVFILVFTLFGVFTSFAKDKIVDKVVATVENQPITAYEITNIAGFYNAKDSKSLIDGVVDDYVVMHYAKNMGIVVTDEDVDDYIDRLAKSNSVKKDEFLKKVKASGVDMDYYKEGIRLQIYKQKFALKMFAPTIKISKEDIERYYALHKQQLNPGVMLVVSIISTKNKNTAKLVYKGLSKGGSFEKLKEQFSMDKEKQKVIPASAFNKQIRSKLLGLKKGEYSDIIESNGVYYIAKLLDKKTASVDDQVIEENVKNILFMKRVESKLNSWLKMVKMRTGIEIFG
jgi:peptidyl-prolyl cis-trans isomerase SurA